MNELRFSRIALLGLPFLLLALGFVVRGLWATYTTMIMLPLVIFIWGTALDLLMYPVFLVFSIWVLRFFSPAMRIIYVSLMHLLYASLWLWMAYSQGGVYSHWCGVGEGYIHFLAKGIHWQSPAQTEFIIALICSSLSYGVVFYALIILERRIRVIKSNTESIS